MFPMLKFWHKIRYCIKKRFRVGGYQPRIRYNSEFVKRQENYLFINNTVGNSKSLMLLRNVDLGFIDPHIRSKS